MGMGSVSNEVIETVFVLYIFFYEKCKKHKQKAAN